MTEKPILFNTEMVRAILDGRKTQTRRLVKPQPVYDDGLWELGGAGWSDSHVTIHPVPGHSLWERQPVQPGDVLWVRETWQYIPESDVDGFYVYAADREDPAEWKWRPSIHMPRKAARLFLQVMGVRIERLRDITAKDAFNEGTGKLFLEDIAYGDKDYECDLDDEYGMAREQFAWLWESTLKKDNLERYGWWANPWVWVIEFERFDGKPAGLWADRNTAQYADQDVLMPAT